MTKQVNYCFNQATYSSSVSCNALRNNCSICGWWNCPNCARISSGLLFGSSCSISGIFASSAWEKKRSNACCTRSVAYSVDCFLSKPFCMKIVVSFESITSKFILERKKQKITIISIVMIWEKRKFNVAKFIAQI